jgi:hypothetical protein
MSGMRNISDYESWGCLSSEGPEVPDILEAYKGTSIVSWYGNIERQIVKMIDKYDNTRNYVYADKLREFLKTWRENEITGSISRTQLVPLKAATAQLAVDKWKLDDYFSNLRDQVRKLIASEEELPRVDEPPQRPMGGRAPSSDFGAQKEPPEGQPPPQEPMGGPAPAGPENAPPPPDEEIEKEK